MAECARAVSARASPIKLVRPEGNSEGDKFQKLGDAVGFHAWSAWIAGMAAVCMMTLPLWWEPARHDYLAVPLFGINFYMFYWYEVWASKVWRYLLHVINEADLRQYSENLRAAKPDIHFHIQNYHIGMQNRRNNTTRSSKIWNSKTHRDGTLSFDQVVRRDKNDVAMKLFFCEFKMDFMADTATKKDMDADRTAFYQEKWVDEFQENCLEYTVQCEGYQRYMLAVLCPDGPHACAVPWYLTKSAFAFAALLCMTVPYRLFIFSRAPKLDWKVCKYLLSGVVEPGSTAEEAVPEPQDEDMPAEGGGREGELRGRSRGQRADQEAE